MKVEMALQMQVRDEGWGEGGRKEMEKRKWNVSYHSINTCNKVSLPDGDQAILGTFLGVSMCVCVAEVCNNEVGSE